MNYNDIGSIMERLENMGLLYDTGERRNGEVVFELRWEPSSEKMASCTTICNPSRPHTSFSLRCGGPTA